jgi:undecaprenyl phosphate-alpha-L-ara4N flippase subunit ArnF
MQTTVVLAAIVMLTLLGDYFIKLASMSERGLASPMFALGALLYALPAAGWFLLMRTHSLAAIGVLYSAATLLLLAALGAIVFRESFGPREAAGVGLALAAVLVMAGR